MSLSKPCLSSSWWSRDARFARSSTTDGLGEVQADGAEAVEVGHELVTGSYVDGAVHRAGQDHVTCLEGDPEAGHLVGEPGNRRDGVAEHRVGAPLGDLLPVAHQHRLDRLEVDVLATDAFG